MGPLYRNTPVCQVPLLDISTNSVYVVAMELKAPKILKKDAVYWAGGGQQLAEKLELERGTVYDWGEYVPKGAAWQIECLQLREKVETLRTTMCRP